MQAIKSSQAASSAEKHENLTGKMAKQKKRKQSKLESWMLRKGNTLKYKLRYLETFKN